MDGGEIAPKTCRTRLEERLQDAKPSDNILYTCKVNRISLVALQATSDRLGVDIARTFRAGH